MRSSVRLWSRIALLAGLGVAQLTACSSDSRDRQEATKSTGKVSLALEAVSQTGNIYRLRNAFFQITNATNGEVVDFLSSEDVPETATQLTTILNTGNYSIQLFDGWFLERVGSGPPPGGNGGTGATAGMGTGNGGGVFAGSPGTAGRGGGTAGRPGKGTPFPDDVGSGGTSSGEGGETSGGEPSTGGVSGGPMAGFGGIAGGFGGSAGGGGQIVEAQLVSDEIQFFTIFGGGSEAFVFYQFRVGEEIIDFNRGRLNVGIGVFEDPPLCEPPEGVLDPQRVLLETHVDAVGQVALFDVLSALATNGGLEADALLLYQQLYDSYATADRARLPDAVHCGDETTNGAPSLNGFPIVCNRVEHAHFDLADGFFATAFVNRMDLAPANGAHCGQQRMIFSSNELNRAFIIFEAQVPNPRPDLGIQGCAPLAQFWVDANAIDDPVERGQRLAAAFTVGAPELLMSGFGPFFTATNLTFGSGQIRTNQFDQDPWTLREFKLALDGSDLRTIPLPVSEAPPGVLWDEASGEPSGAICRENFLTAIDGLLTDDPARMSFVVDQACKDAESRNDGGQNYSAFLTDGFRAQIEARIEGTGLTADDIANRAQFAGSCIGCHEEAVRKPLGNGIVAPFSNGFVHVQEFAVPCGGGNAGLCFQPSPALRGVFLPSRLQALSNLLGIPVEPNPCDGGGGTGGAAGGGPVPGGFGGTPTAGRGGGTGVGGGRPIDPFPVLPPGPAPEVVIDLPAASTPIADLQAIDDEIREVYGDVTLSGRSAQSTH